jgi:hypothetical protein
MRSWFASGATTDDHLVHAVGYRNVGGEDWFLAKDSWQTAWETDCVPGYFFIHGSYVKLKVLAYPVNEEAVHALATDCTVGPETARAERRPAGDPGPRPGCYRRALSRYFSSTDPDPPYSGPQLAIPLRCGAV